MSTITLQWPAGLWSAHDPGALGLHGLDAIMVRSGFDGEYTPVATVRRRLLEPGQSLEDLADDLGESFAREVGGARRVRRVQSPPDAHAPGLTQMLVAELPAGADTGVSELRHLDGLIGTVQPDGRTVVIAVGVTCTPAQLPTVGPEFHSVLASLTEG